MAELNNQHRQKIISLSLGLGVSMLLSLGAIAFWPHPGCACGSPTDRGRWGIGQINSAQKAYHSRHGSFARSLKQLEEYVQISQISNDRANCEL
jgi:hypothetical protein